MGRLTARADRAPEGGSKGPSGTPPRHRRSGVGLEISLGDRILSVQPVEAGVIRLRSTKTRAWPPRRPWAVTDLTGREPVATEADVTDGALRLTTDEVDVRIAEDLRLTFRSADGRDLVVDALPVSFDGAPRVTWTQVMPSERRYFGFGERTGLLEKRGRRYTCWTTDEWRHQGPTTDALYAAVPFHLGLDPDGTAYGIFMDTTFRSVFDLRAVGAGRMTMEAETDGFDWFFLL